MFGNNKEPKPKKEWIITLREQRWVQVAGGEKLRWVVVTRFTVDDLNKLMARVKLELVQHEKWTVTISPKR